jgi:hypothetical protein
MAYPNVCKHGTEVSGAGNDVSEMFLKGCWADGIYARV